MRNGLNLSTKHYFKAELINLILDYDNKAPERLHLIFGVVSHIESKNQNVQPTERKC